MSATIDPELRRAVIEIVDERFCELEVRRSDFIGLKGVVGSTEGHRSVPKGVGRGTEGDGEGTSGVGGGANADGSASRAAWRQHRVWFRRHRTSRRTRLFAASPWHQDGRV